MEHEDLAKMLVDRSYLEGDFVLASGRRSRFYFDCRATTHCAQAMPLIGRAFLACFRREGTQPEAVGGMTSGADPIAHAIAYTSLEQGPTIQSFLVRKERKAHGTRRWIEGWAREGARVAVVDDVVTSGGSVLQAVERCHEEGLEVVHVVVMVDREEGGLQKIREALPDVPVHALFERRQLDALRERQRGGS